VSLFLKLIFLRYFNKGSTVLVHAIKAYWGVKFLIMARDEGRLSASRPGRFIPRERATLSQQLGEWLGPAVRLNASEKRNLFSLPEIKHDVSVFHPVV
jgi:hypothetical protein